MSEVQHTPEPWRLGKSSPSMGVVVADEKVEGIAGANEWAYYGGNMVAESVSPANASRIVACVNACRGPSTQIIEEGPTYQEMWDEIQAVRKATDDDGTHGGPSVLVEQLVETKAKALRERDEARAMVAELEKCLTAACEQFLSANGSAPDIAWREAVVKARAIIGGAT